VVRVRKRVLLLLVVVVVVVAARERTYNDDCGRGQRMLIVPTHSPGVDHNLKYRRFVVAVVVAAQALQ